MPLARAHLMPAPGVAAIALETCDALQQLGEVGEALLHEFAQAALGLGVEPLPLHLVGQLLELPGDLAEADLL